MRDAKSDLGLRVWEQLPEAERDSLEAEHEESSRRSRRLRDVESLTLDFGRPDASLVPVPSSRSCLTSTLQALDSLELSAVELLESCLAEVEARNEELNAFLRLRPPEKLLEEARLVDQARRSGEPVPVLAGIPVGMKDNFAIEGLETTAGSTVLEGGWHPEDAAVTAALRRHGCIIMGSTNMHEFADGPTTDNPHYGRTENPHRHGHTPGGSSGGSAAAVAAGMCVAAMGTDTGGSIRTPAAFCGLAGMKPTFGAVSRAGIYPFSWTLDHAGPLARTVDEVAAVLRAISGPDAQDPAARVAGSRDGFDVSTSTNQPTVAFDSTYFTRHMTHGVGQAFRRALSTLEEDLGCRVVEVDLQVMEHALDVLVTILFSEATAIHREHLEDRLASYGSDVRVSLLSGRFYSAEDYANAQRVRGLLWRSLEALFETVDFLVTPTVVMEAPRWGTQHFHVGSRRMDDLEAYIRCTSPFNISGSPVLSIPCGNGAQGLPVGLQIVGPHGSDFRLLEFGRQFEQAYTESQSDQHA